MTPLGSAVAAPSFAHEASPTPGQVLAVTTGLFWRWSELALRPDCASAAVHETTYEVVFWRVSELAPGARIPPTGASLSGYKLIVTRGESTPALVVDFTGRLETTTY